MEEFAPGYRFSPVDEELVSFYLLNKVKLQLKKDDSYSNKYVSFIDEKDVYGDSPWNVFTDDQENLNLNNHGVGRRKTYYAFTKLKKLTKKGKRVIREAGCGTWHGSSGPNDVKNRTGHLIGSTRTYNFKVKPGKGGKEKEAETWIMHEYSLQGVSLEEVNYKNAHEVDYVLCRITRDYPEGKQESERSICQILVQVDEVEVFDTTENSYTSQGQDGLLGESTATSSLSFEEQGFLAQEFLPNQCSDYCSGQDLTWTAENSYTSQGLDGLSGETTATSSLSFEELGFLAQEFVPNQCSDYCSGQDLTWTAGPSSSNANQIPEFSSLEYESGVNLGQCDDFALVVGPTFSNDYSAASQIPEFDCLEFENEVDWAETFDIEELLGMLESREVPDDQLGKRKFTASNLEEENPHAKKRFTTFSSEYAEHNGSHSVF